MEKLNIALTENTPLIQFDEDSLVLLVKGNSIPEDAFSFYAPLIKWLVDIAKTPPSKLEFIIDLDYFNTSSSKLLLDIIKKLEDVQMTMRCKVSIIWMYDAENEDMYDTAKEYSTLTNLKFSIEKYT